MGYLIVLINERQLDVVKTNEFVCGDNTWGNEGVHNNCQITFHYLSTSLVNSTIFPLFQHRYFIPFPLLGNDCQIVIYRLSVNRTCYLYHTFFISLFPAGLADIRGVGNTK